MSNHRSIIEDEAASQVPKRERTWRWAAWRPWDMLGALLVLVAVYSLVTGDLRLGPVWLLPLLIGGLLVAVEIAHFGSRREMARRLAIVLVALGTLSVQGSAVALVVRLIEGTIEPSFLLRDAALLWVANVIVFGLWYWELDGGGPRQRQQYGYEPTDLLFPQTALGEKLGAHWAPGFIDFLFVAFNASAAFSPTDTMFLSARAKLLMMAQSLTSIVLMAVVAARAINILR